MTWDLAASISEKIPSSEPVVSFGSTTEMANALGYKTPEGLRRFLQETPEAERLLHVFRGRAGQIRAKSSFHNIPVRNIERVREMREERVKTARNGGETLASMAKRMGVAYQTLSNYIGEEPRLVELLNVKLKSDGTICRWNSFNDVSDEAFKEAADLVLTMGGFLYWSKKHKLHACRSCGRSDVRHFRRGMCGTCVRKEDPSVFDKSKRERWSVKHGLDACYVCGRSGKPHASHGACHACYVAVHQKGQTVEERREKLKWLDPEKGVIKRTVWDYIAEAGGLGTRECESTDCEVVFEKTTGSQKYCSARCSAREAARKHRAKKGPVLHKKKCAYCGTPFEAKKKHYIYCDKKCSRMAAYHMRKKRRQEAKS